MRVLVTGICGFVGSRLGRRLLADGAELCAIVRPGTSTAPIADYGDHVRLVEADLAAPEAWRAQVLQFGPERAYHAAWYAKHGRFWSALENLDCVHVTLDLLRVLGEAGCARLVCVGSCAEYAWQHGFLSEERTPCAPSSLYGVAKNATRELVEAAAPALGVSAAWARLFFPYGPGEPATRLIPAVTRALLAGERARCSHGRQVRDFIHVEDCAAALAAIGASELEGPVNLGSGVPASIAHVARTIARLCGRAAADVELGAIPAAEDDPPMIVADVRKLAGTGWEPARTLEDGLTDAVHWWRKAS